MNTLWTIVEELTCMGISEDKHDYVINVSVYSDRCFAKVHQKKSRQKLTLTFSWSERPGAIRETMRHLEP